MRIREAINLLKEEIQKFDRNEVRIKDNKLIYSLGNNREFDISSYNQNTLGELGRALATLKMITEFKIPPEKITLEEPSPVGSPSKRIDMKIKIDETFNNRECIALVECKTSINKIGDSGFTNYFKRQLYNIAHSYARDNKLPYPLILIAYEIVFNGENKIDIFYRWFLYPEIETTVEAKQASLDEVINRNSLYAYTTPPVISSNGEVYFYKKPLTKEDLIEIKNASELKNLLKEKLHQELRKFGIVDDDARDTIVNLLLAKTYDEIQLVNKENKEPDFQVKPEDYLNKSRFYERIKKLLEDASIHLLGEDSRDTTKKEVIVLRNRENVSIDKEKVLLTLVPYLQRIKLRSIRLLEEDTLGDILLDFMHSIARQSRGMFFTHPNICKFVCKALNVEKIGDDLKNRIYKYVIDPSCGSGTFLIEALKLIFKDYSIEDIKENALKILFGMDNNESAVALCKVNMVIHGDGSANIYQRDALSDLSSLPFPNIKRDTIKKLNNSCTTEVIEEGKGFDIIITNPPFSLEIKPSDYPNFVMNRFVPFKNNISYASEYFFIERWFQLLNPDGKIGVVLPASILDSKEYFKARLLFLSYFSISAIIGLPDFAFAPHAQQKTYLVFGKRRPLDFANELFNLLQQDKIDEFIGKIGEEQFLFYEAKEIGYVRIKQRKTVVTKTTNENELDDKLASLISEIMEGKLNYKSNIDKTIIIRKIKEIFNYDKYLNLTNVQNFTLSDSSIGSFIILNNDWEIVTPKAIDINEIKQQKNVFICETGDILENGSGILTPQLLKQENKKRLYDLRNNIIALSTFGDAFPQMLLLKESSVSKRVRIIDKIAKGKFGKLQEGDIVIAPVRPYLKKIAVITKSSTEFLFSKDFIVLRRKQPNIQESFSLFLSLIHDENVSLLESLSSTGKSGYNKITGKVKILQKNFKKIEIPTEAVNKLIEIYDNIYKSILEYFGS
jgi:type I restriction enzyme M protein